MIQRQMANDPSINIKKVNVPIIMNFKDALSNDALTVDFKTCNMNSGRCTFR